MNEVPHSEDKRSSGLTRRTALTLGAGTVISSSIVMTPGAGAEDDEKDSTGQLQCDGSPEIKRINLDLRNPVITAEEPGKLVFVLRPDTSLPDECATIVDIMFQIEDLGFQWASTSTGNAPTTDLVSTTFNIPPGEIRTISDEIHTMGAEAGDTATVNVYYEVWLEGNREESINEECLGLRIEVEEQNPAYEYELNKDSTSNSDNAPGFGILSAITGLCGAANVLNRRIDETDSEDK